MIFISIRDQKNFVKEEVDAIAKHVFEIMKRHKLKTFYFTADAELKKININKEMSECVERSALFTDILDLVDSYHVYGVNARLQKKGLEDESKRKP